MPPFIEQAIEFIEGLSVYTVAGIFVVFILVILGLGRLLKKPSARLTAFSSETGTVLVSRKALQDLIRQACLRDNSVEAARPVVKIAGEKINTTVTLRLASPENLKETSERLQGRITELLQKSLSFDQIGPIEIMVTSFGKNDVDEAAPVEIVPEVELPEPPRSELKPPPPGNNPERSKED